MRLFYNMDSDIGVLRYVKSFIAITIAVSVKASVGIGKIKPMEYDIVEVYTDGPLIGISKGKVRAGVGVWFGDDDKRNVSEHLTGKVLTNNRAELQAVVRAMEVVRDDTYLCIYTDSNYVILSYDKGRYLQRKHTDLWNILYKLREEKRLSMTFEKVKAHIGVKGNESADRLAKEGAWQPMGQEPLSQQVSLNVNEWVHEQRIEVLRQILYSPNLSIGEKHIQCLPWGRAILEEEADIVIHQLWGEWMKDNRCEYEPRLQILLGVMEAMGGMDEAIHRVHSKHTEIRRHNPTRDKV